MAKLFRWNQSEMTRTLLPCMPECRQNHRAKMGVLVVFMIVAFSAWGLWKNPGDRSWSENQPKKMRMSQMPEHPQQSSWKQWFQPLETIVFSYNSSSSSWETVLADHARQQSSDLFLVMFYHVQKTGGSTLYRMFRQMHLHMGLESVIQHNKFLKDDCCGPERPGELPKLLRWRNSTSTTTNRDAATSSSPRKLVVMSFREPLERVVSHYYQRKCDELQ